MKALGIRNGFEIDVHPIPEGVDNHGCEFYFGDLKQTLRGFKLITKIRNLDNTYLINGRKYELIVKQIKNEKEELGLGIVRASKHDYLSKREILKAAGYMGITSVLSNYLANDYKNVPENNLEIARIRGNIVAEVLDGTRKKTDLDVIPHVKYIEAFEEFENDYKLNNAKVIKSEDVLIDPDTKIICISDRLYDETILVEVKTTAKRSYLHELQVQFQRQQYEKAGIKITAAYLVYLKNDGKYQAIRIKKSTKELNALFVIKEFKDNYGKLLK